MVTTQRGKGKTKRYTEHVQFKTSTAQLNAIRLLEQELDMSKGAVLREAVSRLQRSVLRRKANM